MWYDCSRGYPYGFDTFNSPYKTIIDIVLCADCLDAATDTVGRSYNKGKTFEEIKEGIIAVAGSRYASFLKDLFEMSEVKKDIEYLLSKGRQDIYNETFNLLRHNMKDEMEDNYGR